MNKRRYEKRLRQHTGQDDSLLNRGWHSRAYHRHFEGYAEVESTNEKNRTVIRRVYVGSYYRLDLPRRKRVLLRLTYLGLLLLTGIAFGFAASRPVGANRTWYLAIAQMLTLWGLGAVAISLLAHCTAPREMTIGDWKASSKKLRRNALCSALLLELTAFLTGVYLLHTGENWPVHLLCIGLYAVAGLLSVFLNRLEANAPYVLRDSQTPAPEDSAYIDA